MTLSRRDVRSGPALILTGFSLFLAMPPMSLFPIAWVALVPLLIRWHQITSPREAWLEAATAFFILYALSGYWILRHPFWESAAASLGAAILFPLVQGVPFAAALPFRRRYGSLVGISVLAVFSLTVEYLLLYGPIALPWFLLGHTQAEALAFNQFVDLTGVLGLSLWIWLLNGAVWGTLHSPGFRRLIPLVLVVCLIAAPYLYSSSRRAGLSSATSVPVGVVQPAIPATAWADGPPHRRTDRLRSLSDSLLSTVSRSPQLVVWPETSLPPLGQHTYAQELYADLRAWTSEEGFALVSGAIRYPAEGPVPAEHPRRPFNSAILFTGSTTDHYDKRQLVPFAEGVPGAAYWEALSHLTINAGGISGYRAGREFGLLEADSLRFGTQICFESLFGRLHRREVQRGSSFLVVLAQNGWWGKSAGPLQHRAFSRLRAIESRRSVVMATVSGGSSLIRADGSLGRQLGWMASTGAVFEVPVHRAQTVYVTYGDWPGLIAALMSAGIGLLYVVRWKIFRI